MKAQTKNLQDFIDENRELFITIHTGRGGRFWNPGFKTIIDTDKDIHHYLSEYSQTYENVFEVSNKIGIRRNLQNLVDEAISELSMLNPTNEQFLKLKKYGLDLGEPEYIQDNGNFLDYWVGSQGDGVITIDGDYDRIEVVKLGELDSGELEDLLNNSRKNGFISLEVSEMFDILDNEDF